MKVLRSTLVAATLCCSLAHADEIAPPAPAANIFATLTERGFASSLLAKNLTKEWRVLRVANAPEQNALLLMMMGGGGGRNAASPWDDLFYTRGDLVLIADQNYLVAYRVLPLSDPAERRRQQQYLEIWQRENNEDSDSVFATALPPLDENTALSLSLIAIGKSTNLNDIRAFDPAKDLMTAKDKASRKTKIERSISQTNLKQVALSVLQYIQDYDEVFPVMRAARSAAEIRNNTNQNAPVQAALMPYIKSVELFLHPGTGRPYLPNYKISRKNESSIENSSETFLFFEDAPDAEGMRNVAFVDGHVKAFKEADFQTMRKAQGISESGLPSVQQRGFKPKKPVNRTSNAPRYYGAPGSGSVSISPPPASMPRTRPTPSPWPRR